MSYWLVPSELAFSHYQAVVADLAQRFDGPLFLPHVTLYSGPFDQEDPLSDILRELSQRKEVELRPTSVRFSDHFTRSCFIQFEESDLLSAMCEVVRSKVRNPGPYRDDHHLSLFYGDLAESQRDRIRAEISLPPTMSFNLISAVASLSKALSRKDVEHWSEVDRAQLRG
jgi:hypothetical protein